MILIALAFLLLGAGIWHAAVAKPERDPAHPAAPHSPVHRLAAHNPAHPAAPHSPAYPAAPADPPGAANTTYATVGPAPGGSPLPTGFLGLSLEYSALEAYTGDDPAAPNPVFVQLLRNLGGADKGLVIRIGGNSTDATWWPITGMSPPRGISYAITPGWLASARTLSSVLGAKLILGLNLAAANPRLTSAEADALLSGVGVGNVGALELGNEPDVYGVFPWYRNHRRPVFARSASYDLNAFLSDVRRSTRVLPSVAMAGPATAELPWLADVPALAAAEPGLRMVTVHRYPIQGCLKNRSSPWYPSIANLLSDRSSAGLSQALEPYVALAHSHGLVFRVDELNSAALAGCLGRAGISNTFSSALWMLDTLFNLASVGVDGVNVHSLPGAGYELFSFRRTDSGWQAFVHPDYYGMLLFTQAFPAGGRLLPVRAPAGPVKVWATLGPDGRTRVTLINEASGPQQVELQLPPSAEPAGIEWMRAPGASATSDVTLGSQSFGAETSTGSLGAPLLQPLPQTFGSYSIELPPDSAGLLTR